MNSQLHTHLLEEQTPTPFDFEATATAHGWVALRPFEWDKDATELSYVNQLGNGKVIRLRTGDKNEASASLIKIEVETAETLTPTEEDEIRRAVRRMLRLDEDLSEFHQLRSQLGDWSLQIQPGGGRLLRCPTLFEDIVYTLCTTNISWSGTKRMVSRLVDKLGEPFPAQNGWRTFPTAAAIAAAGPEFLRQETGLGYRSAYVWELAAGVVEGRLELLTLEDPELPTEELYRRLRQIKGVGDYAAATILMLLGRYEYLAIDSEMRTFVSKKYFNGQPAGDSQIRAIYAPWGRWQYLAYWFDAST